MENILTKIAPRSDEYKLRRARTSVFGVSVSPKKRAAIFQQEDFHNMLTLERRRAERSRKPFVLMLLDAGPMFQAACATSTMSTVISVVLKSVRETDLVGWYKNGMILGVIFTEINLDCGKPITEILQSKVADALCAEMSNEFTSRLAITTHLYPANQDGSGTNSIPDARLYPDLSGNRSDKWLAHAIKRLIDITGSSALLLLLSPLIAAIALTIKLTSKGAVIFQQERLGRFGVRFKLLKFRTMRANNDSKIHEQYVQRYISGNTLNDAADPNKPVVYKLTNDPRVTVIGKFLRKTSLDELPQLWNVLLGDMSLVGPRPPLAYEFEVYDIWHRRRVFEVRPGVTGLWQVTGRSRTSFDDMVRLDVRYSQSWSLWLDLRILAATPRAVFGGEGAY